MARKAAMARSVSRIWKLANLMLVGFVSREACVGLVHYVPVCHGDRRALAGQ